MTLWYNVDNVDQIPSPALLIYPARVQENIDKMIALCGGASKLRPHVKTHKMAKIVEMKIASGITKFKASTIAEVEMAATAGAADILMAYQPVGPNVDRFIELHVRFPNTRFSALVDTVESVERIAAVAKSRSVVATLYLDLNVGMNRTGIIPGSEAAEVYRTIFRYASLQAGGLHAYDGHLRDPDLNKLQEKISLAFDPVWKLRDQLRSEGLDVPNIIAAGTPTSKLLARYEGVEVGAGTTALWDFGQVELSPDLDYVNAAILLGRVISRPTANRLCIDLGHKAVASEMPQPRVRWFGLEDATPVLHSEEHLVLETDRASEFPVGSVLYGVPRHICPTVALYNEVWVVRRQVASETWPVTARGRRLTV